MGTARSTVYDLRLVWSRLQRTLQAYDEELKTPDEFADEISRTLRLVEALINGHEKDGETVDYSESEELPA